MSLLQVKDLVVEFPGRRGTLRVVHVTSISSSPASGRQRRWMSRMCRVTDAWAARRFCFGHNNDNNYNDNNNDNDRNRRLGRALFLCFVMVGATANNNDNNYNDNNNDNDRNFSVKIPAVRSVALRHGPPPADGRPPPPTPPRRRVRGGSGTRRRASARQQPSSSVPSCVCVCVCVARARVCVCIKSSRACGVSPRPARGRPGGCGRGRRP